MSLKGRAFPVFISAPFPETISSPLFRPTGKIMYLLAPSLYFSKAMRADLLGSYSIVSTTAGTPTLSLLKSIILSILLFPPPLCHAVTLPRLFLPPVFFTGTSNDFKGSVVVISAKSITVRNLFPGDVGLYFLIAIMHLQ